MGAVPAVLDDFESDAMCVSCMTLFWASRNRVRLSVLGAIFCAKNAQAPVRSRRYPEGMERFTELPVSLPGLHAVILGVYAVAALVSRLPSGRLAEARHADRWMIAACLVFAGTLMLYPVATAPWQVWSVRIVHGLPRLGAAGQCPRGRGGRARRLARLCEPPARRPLSGALRQARQGRCRLLAWPGLLIGTVIKRTERKHVVEVVRRMARASGGTSPPASRLD